MISKPSYIIIFAICTLYFYNTSSALMPDNDSLLLPSIEKYDTNTINNLLGLTKKLGSNQPDSAKKYGRQALLLSKSLGFQSGIYKSYRRLAIIDFYQSNYDSALLNIRQVKKNLTDDYKGKKTLASTLLLEGAIYKAQGDYDKSLAVLDSVKNISERSKYYHLYALATNNAANIYRKQARHGNALESYFAALAVIEGKKLDKEEALILGNIGILYKEQEDYAKALAYYKKALENYEKAGDKRSVAMILNNTGNIFFAQKNYAKALEMHQAALEIRQKINDLKGIATSLINIGDVYLELNDYDKALINVNQSIKLNKSINNKEIKLPAKILTSKIFLAKKDYSKALASAKVSLDLSIELNDILQQETAYQILSLASEQKNDYKNALIYSKKAQVLKDSLFSQSNRRTIDELTNKFQFEQQEKTILNQKLAIAQNKIDSKNDRLLLISVIFVSLMFSIIAFFYIYNKQKTNKRLKETNIEINKQNEALTNTQNNLKAANQDLESFTRMASHDLKEPLRMMGSFAQLLGRKNKNLDKSSKEYIKYISDAAQRMNQMLNDMLAYATQNIRIENMAFFNVKDVISTVMRNLHFSIDKSNTQVNIHGKLPNIKGQESLIVQVFQNLISNAIKYKSPELNPIIDIYGVENENTIIITVQDNGMGIAAENHTKAFQLFQRFSNDVAGTGIGLTTCQKIIELHNGSIRLESELGKGTKFILTFPKN